MGKTGTAQMSWSALNIDQRGYSDKTTQSFIGYFPAPEPKFLILVKLKAPEANTAEYSAMPIFHELAQYVIYNFQLPPNETSNEITSPEILNNSNTNASTPTIAETKNQSTN